MGWNPTLEKAVGQVRAWLGHIYSPSQIGKAVHVRPEDGEFGSIHVKIWTNTNEYRVCISLKSLRQGDAYMGAYVSTRKPRAGETWTRGNDLPDGRFSEELWHRILTAIVRYEAQEIKSESWKEKPRDPGPPAAEKKRRARRAELSPVPDSLWPVWQALMAQPADGDNAALDGTHQDAVLLGNLNYQVENGGFGQWVDNGYGAQVAAVRFILQRLGTPAAAAVDAMLARLEPHIAADGIGRWVMGEPHEVTCPDCMADPDTDCDTCLGSGSVEEDPESEGWGVAETLDDEYYAVQDALMKDIEAWFAARATSQTPKKIEPGGL